MPKERFSQTNPRCDLPDEETKRFAKLEGIAEKHKRGENVQNLN